MHQLIVSALVQIMACRLYGAKPLSEPVLDYHQLDTWEQSMKLFILENASENNVYEMSAIFFRGRWVNTVFALDISVLTMTPMTVGVKKKTVMRRQRWLPPATMPPCTLPWYPANRITTHSWCTLPPCLYLQHSRCMGRQGISCTRWGNGFNSFPCNIWIRFQVSKFILVLDGWAISCEITLRLILDLTDDKSAVVQIMSWCHRPDNKPLPEPMYSKTFMASLGHNELIVWLLEDVIEILTHWSWGMVTHVHCVVFKPQSQGVFSSANSWRPRQNCHHFADSIFKCIFWNKNMWASFKISLQFVPQVWIGWPDNGFKL